MAVGAVVQGLAPTVFTTLFEPQVRMAIWSRPSPFPADAPAQDDAPPHFTAECDGCWIAPSGPAPDWLLRDIQGLGEIVAAISGCEAWRARCETVTHRACPRFHQDAVSVRLILAYAGPGPEWAFAGEIGEDLDGRRIGTRRRVRTLQPGDVAIMKGTAPGWEAWPDFPVVLHRSPPAGWRTPRRVLTIDAARPG